MGYACDGESQRCLRKKDGRCAPGGRRWAWRGRHRGTCRAPAGRTSQMRSLCPRTAAVLHGPLSFGNNVWTRTVFLGFGGGILVVVQVHAGRAGPNIGWIGHHTHSLHGGATARGRLRIRGIPRLRPVEGDVTEEPLRALEPLLVHRQAALHRFPECPVESDEDVAGWKRVFRPWPRACSRGGGGNRRHRAGHLRHPFLVFGILSAPRAITSHS